MGNIKITKTSEQSKKESRGVRCPECDALAIPRDSYHKHCGFLYINIKRIFRYSCNCGCEFEKEAERVF